MVIHMAHVLELLARMACARQDMTALERMSYLSDLSDAHHMIGA
jgi:hypothetical protein